MFALAAVVVAALAGQGLGAYAIESTVVCVPEPCPEGCRVFVLFDDVTHEYEGYIEIGC